MTTWNVNKPAMGDGTTFDQEIGYTEQNLEHLQTALYTGWNPALTSAGAAQTWVYLSTTSIRIAEGVNYSTTYPVGTRLKLTQATGGTKYFKIAAIVYSAPNFDITLDAQGLFTVANEAITIPCFSLLLQPPGMLANNSGWTPLLYTCAYTSADDPSYVFTITGSDLTSILTAGMRLRCTQATGGTKYFIITKVELSGSDTVVTIFGGTGAGSYDLNNETISQPFFSTHKAPVGFNLDPNVWKVEIKDTSNHSQASPVSNTWYNFSSNQQISIPIGIWRVSYYATFWAYVSTANAVTKYLYSTLSTGNNTESDTELTSGIQSQDNSGMLITPLRGTKEKILNLTAKTLYYLNFKYTCGTAMNSLQVHNTVEPSIIRAVSIYL